MAKITQIAGQLFRTGGSGEIFYQCSMGGMSNAGSETASKVRYRTAGTLSDLWAMNSTNTIDGTIVITSRINGAAGNQTLSITASTTGIWTDSTHTDTISAGDYAGISVVANGSSGNSFIRFINTSFAATSNTAVRYCNSDSGGTLSASSTTYYASISGETFSDSASYAEVLTKAKILTAGTLKNMYLYVNANTSLGTTTLLTRKNAGNGNVTVSVTTLSTGVFEDTSNTDTIASGDYINFAATTGASSAIDVSELAVDFITTNGQYACIRDSEASNANSTAFGVTSYHSVSPIYSPNATEGAAKVRLQVAVTASQLFTYIGTNSVNGTTTITLRQNAGNSALTLSVSSTTTGEFSDATHSVTLATTDDIDYAIVTAGSSGSLVWSEASMLFNAQTTVGPVGVKTYLGVASASVKTIMGVAIASVKTWDGIN